MQYLFLTSKDVKVQQFKKFGIKISTGFGLTVHYDGIFNVHIKVSKLYWGKLSGLCGNFNGKRKDDFISREKKVLKKAIDFGNSWKLTESCPNETAVENNPCKNASKRVQKAKEECSSLLKRPFSTCNKELDPHKEGYIENCKYDVCACEDNFEACLCSSFATYEEDCKEVGVTIKWKHLKKFAKCGRLYSIKIFELYN